MTWGRVAGMLVVLLGSPGCATTKQQDPVTFAQRYLELAAGEHVDAAYALLSESFRRRCDRTCFARLLASQHDEARHAVADLHTGGAARLEHNLEVAMPDGTALRLYQVGNPEVGAKSRTASSDRAPDGDAAGYRFSQNPLEFYPQSTPEEAVRSFVRAVNAGRYQALWRFVPKTVAEQLTVEQLRQRFEGPARASLQSQLTALQKHWNEPFQVDGTTARLPTGDGQEVRLVLEQGRWRITQLQ